MRLINSTDIRCLAAASRSTTTCISQIWDLSNYRRLLPGFVRRLLQLWQWTNTSQTDQVEGRQRMCGEMCAAGAYVGTGRLGELEIGCHPVKLCNSVWKVPVCLLALSTLLLLLLSLFFLVALKAAWMWTGGAHQLHRCCHSWHQNVHSSPQFKTPSILFWWFSEHQRQPHILTYQSRPSAPQQKI